MMENSGAMSTFLPDGAHSNDVYCEECQRFVKELCWRHATTVKDAPTVPLAVASLPEVLYFADSIERGNSVFAKRVLRPHTIFGPLVAHGDASTWTLKMDNDNCCNWMKFVSVVGQWEEPNLRLLLRDEQVVFVSVKVVLPGEELKLAVEPRYMPMMDPRSAKPTRLVDVHLQINQDSVMGSEIPDRSSSDVKEIVIDDAVEECTVGTCASADLLTNHTMETDPIPQLPLLTTVKGEAPSGHNDSPGYPLSPMFVAASVPKEEDTTMNSCYESDNCRQDYTADEMENIMIDYIVDDAVPDPAFDGAPTNVTIERDPITRLPFPATLTSEPQFNRECSPEYPFPLLAVASKVAKEQKASQDDRYDAPIGRYPFRSRIAAKNGNNPREPEALSTGLIEEEWSGMIDDSDVDRDYRCSASDEESSTASDPPLPAKRPKASTTDNGKQRTCKAVQVSSVPAASTNASAPDRVLTVGSGTMSALTELSRAPCSLKEQYQPRGNAHPSDIYRFVCPSCALHFLSDNLLQWHRQFQHKDTIGAPWTPGIGCAACKTSCARWQTMAAHVEQHGVKPERIQHFRPTSDPCIMRHVASPSDSIPAGSMMDHEPHTICFMRSSSLCHKHACSLRFCSDELAVVHEMQHVPWKPYQGGLQCSGCGWTADNGGQLIEHVTLHGVDRADRKRCRLCGELKGDLQSHVVSRHKTEYDQFLGGNCPEKCQQCEKRLPSKALLKAHEMRWHTTQRAQCFICAKQFPSPNTLRKHTEEHRTPEGLVCPTCQQVFPTYGKFSLHVKKHDVRLMRVCEVCQSVFSNATQLAQHMLGHESDYKHRCELCGKSFKRSGNLAQHYDCVHGERLKKRRKARKEEMTQEGYVCPRRRMDYEDFPHKCEECRLGWLRRGGLEQHRRRKHGAVDRTQL